MILKIIYIAQTYKELKSTINTNNLNNTNRCHPQQTCKHFL